MEVAGGVGPPKWESGMANSMINFVSAALSFWFLCGPASAQVIGAPVTRSHCGLISHDVANLDAANPRRAYWCKSDIEGYLDAERAGHLPRHRGR